MTDRKIYCKMAACCWYGDQRLDMDGDTRGALGSVRGNPDNLPSRRSLSSRRASRLSLRSCRSISWFILFCSFASSLRQHAILYCQQNSACLEIWNVGQWNHEFRGGTPVAILESATKFWLLALCILHNHNYAYYQASVIITLGCRV